MPDHWLTEAERVRFTSYPVEIPEADVVTFFTLTESDCRLLAGLRGDDSRLGFALQYCPLRYLGFVPADLSQAPMPVIGFLSRQLAVSPSVFASYGERSQTRTDHLQEIEQQLGFHKASQRKRKSHVGSGNGRWNTTVRCSCCNCSASGCMRRRWFAQD
jgi:TnpA family transposase